MLHCGITCYKLLLSRLRCNLNTTGTPVIRISPTLALRPEELDFRFVRASGPGGQNVNKVSTAVELRFDAARSPSLSDETRARALALAGSRATGDGVIIIDARRHRSQALNRADAIERLVDLLRRASHRRLKRIATTPGVAAQRRRLQAKQLRGAIKRNRGTVLPDD